MLIIASSFPPSITVNKESMIFPESKNLNNNGDFYLPHCFGTFFFSLASDFGGG